MKSNYKVLTKQKFIEGDYTLVPIRHEDRYKIMQWRNEQIYHLRQTEVLTEVIQDAYFENVVAKLFDQKKPDQLLFSFLKGKECIGYGGLVHINWIDKNAEVSFIMNTVLEKDYFAENWINFLILIEKVGFDELNFHKLFTYAFDLRPQLYKVLEARKFNNEAILKEQYFFENEFKDVLIHSKFNNNLWFRDATLADVDLTYRWVNDQDVRKHSFSQNIVSRDEHTNWFRDKLYDPNCYYLIAILENRGVGSFRIDKKDNEAIISFLLDPEVQGKGLGFTLLKEGIENAKKKFQSLVFVGYVKIKNKPSICLFRKLGFNESVSQPGTLKFVMNSRK